MQNYDTIRVIGRGSFGVCYLVKCRLDGSLCVIKQIAEAEDVKVEVSVLAKCGISVTI
jgi:hypothetical protein